MTERITKNIIKLLELYIETDRLIEASKKKERGNVGTRRK
jgi:hypothetical protein